MLGRFGRKSSESEPAVETDSLVASTSADAAPTPASEAAALGPPLPPSKPMPKMPSDTKAQLDPAGVVITWRHPPEDVQPLPVTVEVQFYKGFGISGRTGSEVVSPARKQNCWVLPSDAPAGVVGRRSGNSEDTGSGEHWAMRLPPLDAGKTYTVRLRCQLADRKGWSEWSEKGTVDTSVTAGSAASENLLSPGGMHAGEDAPAAAAADKVTRRAAAVTPCSLQRLCRVFRCQTRGKLCL
eukprot:COSAG05_NODE_1505_length_4691_cov_73.111498_1_plen_240_part_00